VLESSDRVQAVKSWELYLAGASGKGPWADAALARVDALRKGGNGQVGSPHASPGRSKANSAPKKGKRR
jgi:hypothetical protein